MTTPLARVHNLSITFPAHTSPAVDRVSLEVRAGECVALVGESGSGKSLTARALLGLLPRSAVQHGEIFLGEDPAPANGAAAWDRIRGLRAGLVPQDALGGLDPLRRIELEVGDALRLHRLSPRPERRARVLAALAEAGMPEPAQQLRRRSDQLSGGLRQRALVAAALVADPELILADEPTTALDAGHRHRVLTELQRRVRAGAGALLISHDLVSVRDFADRVLVMRRGRIVEQGDPQTVFGSPTHPFTRELLAASPAHKPRGTRLLPPTPVRPAAPAGPAAATTSPASPAAATTSPASPAAAPAQPIRLELRAVTASYGLGPTRKTVLNRVQLSVAAGETVGLLGESGSGKTTLLRVALGLHQPDTGSVHLDGVNWSALPHRERQLLRRKVALVPQDPLDSFPRGATGAAILRDALRAAGAPKPTRATRATELATEVDLHPQLLQQPAATLSGGQRQRLAIARALAREPQLLLLDEPVSALDITVQARVLDVLDALQQRHGTAYLLVSHDVDVLTHMSDRVLRLERGTIAAQQRTPCR